MMTPNEYQQLALRTAAGLNTGEKILNAILGLNGEAGELADHFKKAEFQGHDWNPDKVALELGDVLWYVALAADALGLSLEQVMERNIKKLEARFPDGFDAERSRNREV
jgi:NTP pyrophosphatase (non-canonical NTP hydrolase)